MKKLLSAIAVAGIELPRIEPGSANSASAMFKSLAFRRSEIPSWRRRPASRLVLVLFKKYGLRGEDGGAINPRES